MIFKEFLESIKRNTLMFVVIIIIFAIALSFLNISINGIQKSNSILNNFNDFLEKNYYRILDDYIEDREIAFRNESNNLYRLKKFNELLNKNTSFNYIETNFQGLYVNDLSVDDKFLYGYENGYAQEAIKLDEKYYMNLKSIQINENGIIEYDLQAEYGNLFESKDFLFRENISIPALLGYEYIDKYSIGDELNVDYLGFRTVIKVIGFFKENSNIIYNDNLVYLDRYIIIPSLDINEISEVIDMKNFHYRLYLNKNNGVIIVNDFNANEIQSIINGISKEANLCNYIIMGASNYKLDILNLHAKEYVILNLIITIIMLIFITMNLVFSLLNKIRKNINTYAVYILNGYLVKQIKLSVFLEIFFYMICANILSLPLSYMALGKWYYHIALLLTSLLIGCISVYISYKEINKINLCNVLRDL